VHRACKCGRGDGAGREGLFLLLRVQQFVLVLLVVALLVGDCV